MHNVGDLVCADIYIGIVYDINTERAYLNCQDGLQHVVNVVDLIPIATAQQLAAMFEGGIINVNGT